MNNLKSYFFFLLIAAPMIGAVFVVETLKNQGSGFGIKLCIAISLINGIVAALSLLKWLPQAPRRPENSTR